MTQWRWKDPKELTLRYHPSPDPDPAKPAPSSNKEAGSETLVPGMVCDNRLPSFVPVVSRNRTFKGVHPN